MQWLTFKIRLESDLGTSMRGDTLFGQLCWMLRLREGERALEELLEGYTDGAPFLIVSDGCPQGFVPKPDLPPPPVSSDNFRDNEEWARRKRWAGRRWLPASALLRPLVEALADVELGEPRSSEEFLQVHNTINRMTGTTGTGMFAPYQMPRIAATTDILEVHCLHHPDRLSGDALRRAMNEVSLHGFGRDASIGLGKFAVESCEALSPRRPADTVVTLAPCRPRPDEVEAEKRYWRPFTRFGRHGGPAFGGKVFKTPVLLADTGAMFTVSAQARGGPFLGRGLGGNERLSRQIPQTVHQAYAPVLPVDLEGWDG